MEPRVIDEGADWLEGSVRRRWRIVEWPPSEYALQEIFSPAERRLQRTWRRTPLDRHEVWEQYPSEAPGMLASHARQAGPRTTRSR